MVPRSRFLIACALLAGLAGCSRQPSDTEAQEGQSGAAPDIAVSAAPGVAFAYQYRFALAADRIAAVQERHAAACEALGLDKCRITGLSFQRRGSDSVSASLDLALAPDLARGFGKDATAAVEAAKGKLAAMTIDAVDRNGALERSSADGEAARTERARLEAEAARTDTTPQARADLRNRIATQDALIRQARTQGDDVRTQLARTPMQIIYSTDGFLPGFSLDRTAWSALAFAGMLLNGLFALIVVLAVLAVPAGLLLLLFAHGRKQAKRLWDRLAPRAGPDIG